MALDADIQFDEQGFMWDFIKQFSNKKEVVQDRQQRREEDDVETSSSPQKFAKADYDFFTQINSKDPIAIINKMVGYGIDELSDLTNAQVSSLIPKIKLYKIVPFFKKGKFDQKKRYLFPFSTHTTLESITKSMEDRGTDAGIKSISIRDTGVNPANVGISFKGTLNLHFQSFEALFKLRWVDQHRLSFSQLMDLVSLKGTEYRDEKTKMPSEVRRRAAAAANCMPPFEIQLELGWQTNQDVGGVLKVKKDRIEKLTRKFNISPIQQRMDIQENGSLNLALDFWAAIEGKSLGSAADLFYIDEEQATQLADNIKITREAYKAKLLERKEDTTGPQMSTEAPNQSMETEETEAHQFAAAKDAYRAARSERRRIATARLMSQIKTDLRLFYVDLKTEQLERYKAMLSFVSETAETIKSDNIITAEEIEKVKKERETFLSIIRPSLRAETATDGSRDLIGDRAPSPAPTQSTPEETNKVMSSVTGDNYAQKNLPQGWHRLHYFYLGDLLEAAMRTIHEQPEMKSSGKTAGKGQQCEGIKEHIKLVTGPFVYVDPVSGKEIIMNIGDIPVSLRYFNTWWFETITKYKQDHLPLRAFLKNLCASLINNLLSPKRYGPISTFRSLRPQILTLNLPLDGFLDQANNRKFKNTKFKIVDFDVLNKKEQSNFMKRGHASQVSEWLFMYIGGESPVKLKGSHGGDKRINIPHFSIGASSGILKKVNLSRTKIPFRLEASLSHASNPAKRNLLYADRYDAELIFVGNPTFKPGMLIFLDPRSLGLGGGGPSSRNPEWRADLGIGGYYRIIDVTHEVSADKFETRIRTIAERTLRDIKISEMRNLLLSKATTDEERAQKAAAKEVAGSLLED